MRICHVTYEFTGHSGAAKQAKTLIKALSLKGCDSACVLSLESKAAFDQVIELDGVVVHVVPRKTKSIFFAVLEQKKRGVDVMHLHGFSFFVLFVAFLLRIPIILKTTLLGEDDFQSLSNAKYGLMKRAALFCVSKNVVLSKALLDINKNFIPKEKIVRIPNGVEMHGNLKDFKKENAFCVVGLVCPRKRTLDAIKYFVRNYLRVPGSVLFVVGPAEESLHLPEFDAEYVRLCREFSRAEGQGRVVFTGNLSSEDLHKLYIKCIGTFLFSVHEGMPNVLLEAMARNCVPIVSEMDGVAAEIIEHGSSGFILKEFSEVVDFDEVVQLSQNELQFSVIETGYKIEKVAERYMDLYRECSHAGSI